MGTDKALRDEAIAKFNDVLKRMEVSYKKYAEKHDLTAFSLTVLELIYDSQNPLTQKDIKSVLGVPKQAVNVAITFFLKREYIQLKEGEDRRNKNILFTEKGMAYAQQVIGEMRMAEEQAWREVPTQEMLKFVEFMVTSEQITREKLLGT